MPNENPAATKANSAQSAFVLTIFWIGLVAGTLDITDNLIYNSMRAVTPKMVFQFIASGLIGMKSFQMGAASFALGVAIHYSIALTWTAIFLIASRKLTILIRRPVVSGLLYGCLVYLFMNLVAVPLSRVPHLNLHVTLAGRINAVLAVVLCIGLTIALLAHWSSTRSTPRTAASATADR